MILRDTTALPTNAVSATFKWAVFAEAEASQAKCGQHQNVARNKETTHSLCKGGQIPQTHLWPAHVT